MLNDAFKSISWFFRENGVPYKMSLERAIRNLQWIAIQWFCITYCSNILCAKNQLCYFWGKHRWLFDEIRWSGLQPIYSFLFNDCSKFRLNDDPDPKLPSVRQCLIFVFGLAHRGSTRSAFFSDFLGGKKHFSRSLWWMRACFLHIFVVVSCIFFC